jgi:hypothetical protein
MTAEERVHRVLDLLVRRLHSRDVKVDVDAARTIIATCQREIERRAGSRRTRGRGAGRIR